MQEPRCIAQLLRNESPRLTSITTGRDARESLSAPKQSPLKKALTFLKAGGSGNDSDDANLVENSQQLCAG